MKKITRIQFDQYTHDVAEQNHVADTIGKTFNIEPEVQQAFHDIQGEQAGFLKSINTPLVDSQSGQKIGFGVGSPIAGRNNTDNDERATRDVSSMNDDKYFCEQTNFDTHMKYKMMDAWAHTGDLSERYAMHVGMQVARDKIMIGWNGESAATDTDISVNPKLQDVNIGWLAKARNKRPGSFMGYDSSGQATSDEYKVGAGGKYKTLDSIVFDMTTSLLDSWHQDSEDLVVIVGRDLWVAHGLGILESSNLPTERAALSTWFANKAVAGYPAVMVPFFPKRGLVVTSYDNLSIYSESGSLRRAILDNPKRDRVEEYLSSNDAYVVEDYGKFCGVRDGAILLPDGEGSWG